MKLNANDVLDTDKQERLLEVYLTVEPYSRNFFETALSNGCTLTAYIVLIAIKQKRWRACLYARNFTPEAVKVFKALGKDSEIIEICCEPRLKNYRLAYKVNPQMTLERLSKDELYEDLLWLAHTFREDAEGIKAYIKEDAIEDAAS